MEPLEKMILRILHPVMRENNWKTRSLVIAGNFNMTNVDELFDKLVELGQYPVQTSDTITILEKIGHFLDKENEISYRKLKAEGYGKRDSTEKIAADLDLRTGATAFFSCMGWWLYAIGGVLGHGDAFVLRDPAGIRPAFYYADDEIVVAASERPVIQTTLNVPFDSVKEVQPGYALDH